MLKKRILASSLASVMALSSVSVVAFADETATADIKTEAVTKAQLKEYLKAAETFMDDELDDYGTVQSEQFEVAYDRAKVVADNADASDEEITAAYQMLKAVWNGLDMYTNADVQALIDEYEDIYDSENIMNKDFGDLIYDPDTYDEFADAYDQATIHVDSSDSRVLNDVYVALVQAKKGLDANDFVTKGQFRAAYQEFIDLVSQFEKYEDWRRGSVSENINTGKLVDNTDTKLNLTKADFVTFGEIKDIVYGTSIVVPKGLAARVDGTWIKLVKVDDTAYTDVETMVEAAFQYFNTNKNTNKTTDEGIVNAYNAAKNAVKLFNSWDKDGINRGTKKSANSLVDKEFRSKLLAAYPLKSTNVFYASFFASTKPGDDLFTIDGGKVTVKQGATLASINALVVDGKTNKLKIDANGEYTSTSGTGDTTIGAVVGGTGVAEGDDVTDFIPFTSKMVDAGDTAVAAAVKALEACNAVTPDYNTDPLPNNYSGLTEMNTIDTLKTITKKTKESEVYTLVYRALYYALHDKFDTPAKDYYKLKDLNALIKDANDLIEEVGDVAMFKTELDTLDKYRKAATEYVAMAKADKNFKDDGKTGAAYNGAAKYNIADHIEAGKTSTEVYEELEDEYDALKDIADDYPVSYGMIRDLIAEASEAADNGAYGASTDKIKAAIETLAFDLVTLDASAYNGDEDINEPFDEDDNFLPYNRLAFEGNDAEETLYADYLAALAAIEAAKDEPVATVAGDLDGDGIANTKDALMIVKYAIGEITLSDAQVKAGDVDGNGATNAADALAIINAFLG